MPYRSDLDALRTREEALSRELAELAEAATKKARLERELDEVRACLRAKHRQPLRVLRAPPIPLPCDVPWDSMLGDARVRHCGLCEKKVYNLSAMTRREAAELLQDDDAQCVRYYERPDGTVLTSDCPIGARTRRRRRTASAALTLAGAVGLAASASAMTPYMDAARPVLVVSVDQAVADARIGRVMRVEGTLVHGSIEEHFREIRFELVSRGVNLPVRFVGTILPDTFRDVPGLVINVMVEGELRADGTFVATNVLAKVPSGARYMDR